MTKVTTRQPLLATDPLTEHHDLRGEAVYWRPAYLSPAACVALMDELMERTHWRQESILLYGKEHDQPRLTGWYGLAMSAASRYREAMTADAWTERLAGVRDRISEVAGVTFNSVLVNLYRDGQDSMGMHADDEPCLGPAPWIASLSLGATRRFQIRTRTRIKHGGASWSFDLQAGDLLLMSPGIQRAYLHGISKTSRPCGPRINLTFRELHPNP